MKNLRLFATPLCVILGPLNVSAATTLIGGRATAPAVMINGMASLTGSPLSFSGGLTKPSAAIFPASLPGRIGLQSAPSVIQPSFQEPIPASRSRGLEDMMSPLENIGKAAHQGGAAEVAGKIQALFDGPQGENRPADLSTKGAQDSPKPPSRQASPILKAKIGHGRLLKFYGSMVEAISPYEEVLESLDKYDDGGETGLAPMGWKGNSAHESIRSSFATLEAMTQALGSFLEESQRTTIAPEKLLQAADFLAKVDVRAPILLSSQIKEYLGKASHAKEGLQEILNRVSAMSKQEQQEFMERFLGSTMEIAIAHAQESLEEASSDYKQLLKADASVSWLLANELSAEGMTSAVKAIAEGLELAAELALQSDSGGKGTQPK